MFRSLFGSVRPVGGLFLAACACILIVIACVYPESWAAADLMVEEQQLHDDVLAGAAVPENRVSRQAASAPACDFIGEGQSSKSGDEASSPVMGEVAQALLQALDVCPVGDKAGAPDAGRCSQSRIVALIDTGAPGDAHVISRESVIGEETADDNGHGARMLERIVGENSAAEVISIKALDARGFGTGAGVYAAIERAIARGAGIINLSLSARDTADNAIIARGVRDALDAGCVVVASAGNGARDAGGFTPANVDGVYTVGAGTSAGEVLASSNRGPCVDAYAIAESTSVAAARVTGWLSAHRGDGWRAGLLASGVAFEKTAEAGADGVVRASADEAGDAVAAASFYTTYVFNSNGGHMKTSPVRHTDNLYYKFNDAGQLQYSRRPTSGFREAWHSVIDTDYQIDLFNMVEDFGLIREGYHVDILERYYNTEPDGSGFYVNADGARARDAIGGETLTEDVKATMYVNWIANRYTVTYDANGGTGAPSPTEHVYGTASPIASGKPSKEGFEFAGWRLDGADALYGAGQLVDGLTTEDGATVVLRAEWLQRDASIRYHGWQGSTFMPGDEVVPASSSAPVTLPSVAQLPEAEGSPTGVLVAIAYDGNGGSLGAIPEEATRARQVKSFEFSGWYTDTDGGTRVGGAGDGFTPQPGDNDLYMRFSEGVRIDSVTLPASSSIASSKLGETVGSFEVTLDANGAGQDCVAQPVLTAFKVRSYEAVGWSADSGGGSTVYGFGESYAPAGQTKLYVAWDARESTESLHLPTPVRTGYDFLGWSPDADARSGITGDYTPTSSETLYAVWEKRSHLLEFDANGGAGAMEALMVDEAGGGLLPLCSFTHAGCLFAGWNENPDGSGRAYADGCDVHPVEGVRLYAQWSPVQLAFSVPSSIRLKETVTGTLAPLEVSPMSIGNESDVDITVTGVGFASEEGLTLKRDPVEEGEYSLWLGPSVSGRVNAAEIERDSFVPVTWRVARSSSLVLEGVAGKIVRGSLAMSGMRQLGTATWRIASRDIEVSFHGNGASGAMESQRMPEGASFALPRPRFEAGEAVFAGWNTAPDGTGEAYESSQAVAFHDDVVLYAQWA